MPVELAIFALSFLVASAISVEKQPLSNNVPNSSSPISPHDLEPVNFDTPELFASRPAFRRRIFRAQCEARCFDAFGTRLAEWADDVFGAWRCDGPCDDERERVVACGLRRDNCKACVFACRQTYQQESRCVSSCGSDSLTSSSCISSCRFLFSLFAADRVSDRPISDEPFPVESTLERHFNDSPKDTIDRAGPLMPSLSNDSDPFPAIVPLSGRISMETPILICRQNLQHSDCEDDDLTGVLIFRSALKILSNSSSETPRLLAMDSDLVVVFLVEISSAASSSSSSSNSLSSHSSPWAFLSDSPSPVHRVFCLSSRRRFRFRVTPISPLGVVSAPLVSDWIETAPVVSALSPPRTPIVVGTKRLEDGVEKGAVIYLNSTISFERNEEASCFYRVYWMPTPGVDNGVASDAGYGESRLLGPIVDPRVVVDLTPLRVDRRYQIEIFSVSSGSSSVGDSSSAKLSLVTPSCLQVTGVDLDTCPPPPPDNLQAVEVEETKMTVTWDSSSILSEGSKVRGITGYLVEWRKIPDLASAEFATPHENTTLLPPHAHSIVISGLHADAAYRISLRARSRGGISNQRALRVRTEGKTIARQTARRGDGQSTLQATVAIFGVLLILLLAGLLLILGRRCLAPADKSLDTTGQGEKITDKIEASLFGRILRCSTPQLTSVPRALTTDEPKHFFPEVVSIGAPLPGAAPLVPTAPGAKKTSVTCDNAIYEDAFEIRPQRLRTMEALGQGAFGRVFRGELEEDEEDVFDDKTRKKKITTVAVKSLKEGATTEDVAVFKAEIRLMKTLGRHPHVLGLVGCVTAPGHAPCIVTEYCPYGDLKNFLRSQRSNWTPFTPAPLSSVPPPFFALPPSPPPTPPILDSFSSALSLFDLVSFCRQVASGMEFLANNRFVHRDLAARNILVAEDRAAKISDFGLARDVYVENVYRKLTSGKLPFKWMSPEAIFDQVYTTASDVWAFGVVVWEVMTMGGAPYPGVAGADLLRLLNNGHRMQAPPIAPTEVKDLMYSCWKKAPDERPRFGDLRKDLERIEGKMLEGGKGAEDYLEFEGSKGSNGSVGVHYAQIAVKTFEKVPESTSILIENPRSFGDISIESTPKATNSVDTNSATSDYGSNEAEARP